MRAHHIVLWGKGGDFWLGGREYIRNSARALLSLPQAGRDFDLSVLVNGQRELAHFEELRPRLRVCDDMNVVMKPWNLPNRIEWFARRKTGRAFDPRTQDYLTSIGATFVYPAITAPPDVQPFRSADWIPDFQYLHFPSGSNPVEIEGRKADFARIARDAQTVVLSSAHAQRDFAQVFPAHQSKSFVLQFRASLDDSTWKPDPMEVVRRYHLPERFLLVSNMLAPTKNHQAVLAALKVLRERGDAVPVAFTGDIYDYRNPGFYNQFLARIHEYGVHASVYVLGLMPRLEQLQLLRACRAVVQPSLFEGWHTGVEEAHLVGKPIVLSDIPVHREQAPPLATYFPPEDPAALADAMKAAFETGRGFDRATEEAARANYAVLQHQFAQRLLTLATGA